MAPRIKTLATTRSSPRTTNRGFGGGENAFNVFDNILGPGNAKWCCGQGGGISIDNPMWVSAQLPIGHFLTNFTVSSANDVPDRDPTHWAIQGSNDGSNYSDIYVFEDDFGPWFDRLEVIEFKAGDDFPAQTTSYEYFRMATYNTIANPSGAYFQVGEIEFFGTPDGNTVLPLFIGGESTIGSQTWNSTRSNEVLGEPMPVPGFTGRIVTIDEHGLTIGNHTDAEIVLDDFDGTTVLLAYPVVDMGGGGGTFGQTQAYPNGVTDTSQSDFAVRVEANVKIPAGTWAIGFGSDDGGQVTINGIEIIDASHFDALETDQIRFEGNRGHGWTVGTFTLDQELETTLVGSFHERGGGDSFEIAVIDEDTIDTAVSAAAGWELLGNGAFGWEVSTTASPLLSADLSAQATNFDNRPWQFDVNGDTDMADQFVVDNPDPNVYTTILDVDGLTFEIRAAGTVAQR